MCAEEIVIDQAEDVVNLPAAMDGAASQLAMGEQAHECETPPSVTPTSPNTPTAQGSHRRPPAPHARRLSPRHPHCEVVPRHQRLHGTRAAGTAGHTRSAELPHRASASLAFRRPVTEERAHSQGLPSHASTGNCPATFSAGRDPTVASKRKGVEAMTAPVGRVYHNAGDIGGSGDSNPEQTLKNFSADDPSAAVKFDEVLHSIRDGDRFLGRYVLNFTDRLDLGMQLPLYCGHEYCSFAIGQSQGCARQAVQCGAISDDIHIDYFTTMRSSTPPIRTACNAQGV